MTMNPHLSHEQFARCFIGTANGEELRHIAGCGACKSELEDFGKTVSSLRVAIRERVDEHIEAQPFVKREPKPLPMTQWALVTVVVLLLGLVPFLATYPVKESRPMSVSSAEALMGSINAHLSRTVPTPMEPMMSLLPGDEVVIVWGGSQ
jgi:anti-sigma factor RsiW